MSAGKPKGVKKMKESDKHAIVWLRLTIPVAILLAIAAGNGVFVNGLYRDNANFASQAIGQDLISLLVALPALIISAILTHHGSARARLIWLGMLVYLVYSYMIAAFEVRFNSLFLVYVALLGSSLYALIGGLTTADIAAIKSSFTDKTPVRTVSVYLGVLMVLFYFLWLNEVLPTLLAGKIPQSIVDNGTPTNAVHALDMAWMLPAFGITAVSLWRRRALGYTLAGATLLFISLLALAVLSMVLFMIRQGHAVAVPQVAIFVVLFAASLGMLIWFMKGMQSRTVAQK